LKKKTLNAKQASLNLIKKEQKLKLESSDRNQISFYIETKKRKQAKIIIKHLFLLFKAEISVWHDLN
jgi:hypothetical protein